MAPKRNHGSKRKAPPPPVVSRSVSWPVGGSSGASSASLVCAPLPALVLPAAQWRLLASPRLLLALESYGIEGDSDLANLTLPKLATVFESDGQLLVDLTLPSALLEEAVRIWRWLRTSSDRCTQPAAEHLRKGVQV